MTSTPCLYHASICTALALHLSIPEEGTTLPFIDEMRGEGMGATHQPSVTHHGGDQGGEATMCSLLAVEALRIKWRARGKDSQEGIEALDTQSWKRGVGCMEVEEIRGGERRP